MLQAVHVGLIGLPTVDCRLTNVTSASTRLPPITLMLRSFSLVSVVVPNSALNEAADIPPRNARMNVRL